ncbi:hypothetical protein OA950_02120 [Candidatus Pelagibacter sp.]|nr:hypothetical protein [Candidatus Pelagibacter sp.]
MNKNKKFKNISLKNECIIFGNGASIKKFNLRVFYEYDSIVTTMMYLHKDFNNLRVVADCEIAPFILYKFWKNPYSKKIENNAKLNLFEKTQRFSKEHPYFLSLTNYLSKIKKKNFYYLYNFKEKNFSTEIDISKKFTYLSGSIFCMIGLAKYFGYKKIFLVGVDYLLDPPIIGHFYEKDHYNGLNKVFLDNEIDFFEKIKSEIEINVIVPKGTKSKLFNSINYEEYFEDKEIEKENYDIVSKNNLKLLDNLKMEYRIF